MPATQDGFNKLMELDRSFIGSRDYMGLAYFWAYEFRHALRDASPFVRRKVHADFIKAGLPPDGFTREHLAIVRKRCPMWLATDAHRLSEILNRYE